MRKPKERKLPLKTQVTLLNETVGVRNAQIASLLRTIDQRDTDLRVANGKAMTYLELANKRSLQLEDTIDRKVRKFFRILFNLEQT